MAMTTNKIKRKKGNEKITMLTCYDFQMAKILDSAGVDMLLIGDSLGNVVMGLEHTTGVTMADMVHHVAAVKRGVQEAMLVADMPFLSFNLSIQDTLVNAGELIRAGATAVKLEGGRPVVPQIKALTEAGIPVMGHLGLTPQAVNQLGGFLIQGKTPEAAQKIIDDALALQEAGVFSMVLECVPTELAELITQKVSVPTIGIGAGPKCDGQVLVVNDMLGMDNGKTSTFVKRYADLHTIIQDAAKEYVQEVKDGQFPTKDHVFHASEKLY